MGIVQRLLSYLPERRGSSHSVDVNDPRYWSNFFSSTGSSTKAGQYVSPETALQSTVVFACVRVIAETVASLPLMVYRRRKDGGKEPDQGHPLYSILHNLPNSELTSCELFEMLTGHCCLRGNSYSYIERDMGGRVLNLYPLNPARMRVFRNDRGAIVYEYQQEDGKTAIIPFRDVWHIRGLSTDGLVGLSPVSMAREAIGLSMAVEDYGERFFANNAKPSGILTYPGKLQEDQKERLASAWQSAHAQGNAHKVAVLEGGLTWTAVGISNEDAQFLELRNYQVEDIARIFRVPGVLIGHPDKTSTYASAEQFFLSFVVHTIRPWLVRIEQSINRCLLTEQERKKYFAEFKLEGLLRGDLKSRYEAYQIGKQNGWLSTNDIRNLENMNPVENGDEYWRPVNIGVVGEPDPVPEPEPPAIGGDDGQQDGTQGV